MLKQLIDVVVAEREALAEDIIAVDLAARDGSRLPLFEAGAHVEAHIAEGLVRPYSLCNAPSERHRYRLGVLRDTNSRGGSQRIFDEWQPGHALSVSFPRNLFPLVRTAGRSLLVGGGIGITPLISMAHHLAATGGAFGLHYCIRDESRAAFLPELRRTSFASHVQAHYSAVRRFCFDDDIGAPADGDHIYVCGPQPFMDHVIGSARNAGWRDDQIHFELFDVDVDMIGAPFAVETRDGRCFEIPPGRSIAEVLMSNGVDVDISCEKGICGSCVVDVLEGTPDHRDHYLTEEERARNDCIALCCSRARGARLKLAI
ncbi:MAG: PDR/VanB family oxidoreductase [Steroidobacteraceae bacterium]